MYYARICYGNVQVGDAEVDNNNKKKKIKIIIIMSIGNIILLRT